MRCHVLNLFPLRRGLERERVTRLELATSSLARRCSTTELHPRAKVGSNNRSPLRLRKVFPVAVAPSAMRRFAQRSCYKARSHGYTTIFVATLLQHSNTPL